MTQAAHASNDPIEPTAAARELLVAMQHDFELIAIIHDRELSAEIVEALKAAPFGSQLAIRFRSQAALSALAGFETAVRNLPQSIDHNVLDELAVLYADVYLRHSCRVQPTGSFWLTEDHLERQAPMLEMRTEMRRAGLRLTDWAGRTEDHLVPQMLFIARLLAQARNDGNLETVGRILDEHLLRWVRAFAAGLAKARGPAFYVALAELTAAWLDEARDVLAGAFGIARPAGNEVCQAGAPRSRSNSNDPRRSGPEAVAPYVPGAGPGW